MFLAMSLAIVIVGYFYFQLPPMEILLDARDRGSVTLKDRDGNIFAWRGKQFEGSLRSETVSPALLKAIISVEDRRFYQHFGISPRGILGAVRINLSEGRGPFKGHGGSTITQQVAKLLCLLQAVERSERECRRPTIARKLLEIPFSFAMELRYSKSEILSIYLNRAYLGSGSYGFEAASQRYFGKSARDVNIAESAMLAGLLKAPTRLAPTNNLLRAQNRAALVIELMKREGYLNTTEVKLARKHPATLYPKASQQIGGYFADWIMSIPPKELTSNTSEDVLIKTTFNPQIQLSIEQAVGDVYNQYVKDGSKSEVAVVVMSKDGQVLAMLGGREINGGFGKFNRAVQAFRQPGSAFKPFVYAAALDQGLGPNFLMEDEPMTYKVSGSKPYTPKNYTGEYLGTVTLTESLAKSINTVAVKLANTVGLSRVRAIAKDFGIRSKIGLGPAIALGASEVNLLELTSAYAGILAGGRSVTPVGLTDLRLRGADNSLMSASSNSSKQVIDEAAAAALVYMLKQVVDSGTGVRAGVEGWEVAGKTGTTQGARDAWFIGFTSNYVTGVWMGYDDNTSLSGVTGGGLPAEVWSKCMERILKGGVPKKLPLISPDEYASLGFVNSNLKNEFNEEKSFVSKSLFDSLFESLFGN